MKIGKYEIVGGPNWQWYAVTAFIVYASVENKSVWPILGWLGFWVLMIPLCLWIHKLTQPKHTFESTVKKLADGLEDGSIVLREEDVQNPNSVHPNKP